MDSELDLENTVEEEEEENVQLTSAELIQMMEEIWLNEKFAPELLPHKQEIVDCVLGQISYMEKNVETLQSSDFKKGIHQLEVDRIRFLVTSYLRRRLEKIENFVFCILENEAKRVEQQEEGYLTEAELEFATKYKEALEQHLDGVTDLPFEEWKKRPTQPNMNSFVFLRAKNAVQGVVVDKGSGDDSEVVDLNVGSQMLISYSGVADLVKRGDLHLI